MTQRNLWPPTSAVLLLVCLVSFGGLTSATAQRSGKTSSDKKSKAVKSPSALEVQVNDQAFNFVNQTFAAATELSDAFRNELDQFNKLRVLDAVNLDSTNVEANAGKTLHFVSFLDGYLRSSDSIQRAFEDSIFVLQSMLPKDAKDKTLGVLLDSYKLDASAHRDYVTALKQLVQQAGDILLFLRTSEHSIGKDGLLLFHQASDTKTYRSLMKPLDQLNLDLRKANEASQKASEKANRQIQQVSEQS